MDEQVDGAGTAAPTATRRLALRAGLAALGGVITAAVVVDADPVAASGGPITTGTTNTESVGLTTATFDGSAAGSAFLFASTAPGSPFLASTSAHPSALAGWTSVAAKPYGIYGYSSVASGTGVVGSAPGTSGTGVRGDAASGIGVHGVSTANGAGVLGEGTGDAGVFGRGTAEAYGVLGTSALTDGVFGGAYGDGAGVRGTSFAGSGVVGAGPVYGLRVEAANRAALHLASAGFGTGSTARTAPASRTDAHSAGEIDVDVNGDLWVCVAAGSPGTWRKLGGVATAGSFHPVTPGRVYDSRAASPGPGAPLAWSKYRTVSVAGRRDLTTGAVLQDDFVPTGATAITANITVVNTVAAGFLTVNPGGTTTVNAATINWSATGQILNNGVTLTLGANRDLTVVAGGDTSSSTHFVVDVSGYYL